MSAYEPRRMCQACGWDCCDGLRDNPLITFGRLGRRYVEAMTVTVA